MLLGLFLLSSFEPIAAATESSNDSRATYNCYFVNPTDGETVSGQVVVDFYGDYKGRQLANARIRVLKDGSALTDYFTMTHVGGNHWQITWDTETFDNDNGYTLHVRAYRTSTRSRSFYCNNLIIDNAGGGDTTPPSVTITNPSNGATVSSTVSITATASDNVGVTKVQCQIDSGSWVDDTTSPYSWTWDTTLESDGTHTITCRAWDAAGNYADDTNTVTVSNGGGGGNELENGVPVQSSLAAQYDTEMWTIEVGPNGEIMHSVLTCGSADFDLYGRLGAEPTTSTYDWRGYTTSGEDVTYPNPGEGTWYIMVRSYSGTGSYELTVTVTYGGGGSEWGTGGKYAIIVGISDYSSISDLSYCDEDATDWYYYLIGQGYECHVYGDGHTSDYPRHDGYATESNVRNAIVELMAHAQPGDHIVFATSGHGSGDGSGSSYLCMWDCSGSAGCYYDTELRDDLSGANGEEIFIFIDHCYSGGMGPELSSIGNLYCATTCTEDGYGWDDGSHQNGMWTYWFLEAGLIGQFGSSASTTMEEAFDWASANYPYQPPSSHAPMEFDYNPGDTLL